MSIYLAYCEVWYYINKEWQTNNYEYRFVMKVYSDFTVERNTNEVVWIKYLTPLV